MSYRSLPPHLAATLPHLYDQPVALRFTASDQWSDALVRNVQLIRYCVAAVQRQWDFDIEAAVVLPAEMQLLATFQAGEYGIAQAAALIQGTFDGHVIGDWCGWSGPALTTNVDRVAIPLRRAFIEAAPVRMGLVDDPSDWAYSSAHRRQTQVDALGAAVA